MENLTRTSPSDRKITLIEREIQGSSVLGARDSGLGIRGAVVGARLAAREIVCEVLLPSRTDLSPNPRGEGADGEAAVTDRVLPFR